MAILLPFLPGLLAVGVTAGAAVGGSEVAVHYGTTEWYSTITCGIYETAASKTNSRFRTGFRWCHRVGWICLDGFESLENCENEVTKLCAS